jgi:hypothetical protein
MRRRWAASLGLFAPIVGIFGALGLGIVLLSFPRQDLSLETTAFVTMLWLGAPFATYWLWRRLSGREIRQQVAFGGTTQPLWKAILVLLIAGFLGWVLFVGCYILMFLVLALI